MNKVVSVLLTLLIAVLYTSIMFFGLNVIFPENNDVCYREYNNPKIADYNEKEMNELNIKQQKCYDEYEDRQNSIKKIKLIVLSIFNLLILVGIYFLKKNESAIGIFLGAIVSSIIATIAFFGTSSVIALIVLVLIFGVIVYLTNKVEW